MTVQSQGSVLPPVGFDPLRMAAAAYLARFKCQSRSHAETDFPRSRISEATGLDVSDLGEEHGHRVVRVLGKGHKIVLVPMPPAVARAVDRAVGNQLSGPILRNRAGRRMDRHAATRRLHRLQRVAGVRIARTHPHMLQHTFVTMLDAGVDLRDTDIAARHADPRTTMPYDRARTNLDRHANWVLAAYMSR